MSPKIKRFGLCVVLVLASATLCFASDQDRQRDKTQKRLKDGSCQTDLSPSREMPVMAADKDRKRDRDRKKDGSCQTDLSSSREMPVMAADKDRKRDRDRKKDGSCPS